MHIDFAIELHWINEMQLVVSMSLYVYYDQRNKHVHVDQHVLPIRVEVFVVQVTMSFDDDYDQHNKDDRDYQIELPNLEVTKD